jgi:DNA-binding PadR family transcriptional regulator
MADREKVQRNLWTLNVLSLLREAPMHPYEMQRLIRERKKDEFLDLKRGSLYQNIGRLDQAGLIAKLETTRDGKRPERTVYRLTEAGERDLLAWLRDLLANPGRDSIPFAASVGLLAHLTPEDVRKQLRRRSELLETEIARLDAALAEHTPELSRLVSLEAEFTRAVRQAELAWVRSLIAEIGQSDLTWNPGECFPAAISHPRTRHAGDGPPSVRSREPSRTPGPEGPRAPRSR